RGVCDLKLVECAFDHTGAGVDLSRDDPVRELHDSCALSQWLRDPEEKQQRFVVTAIGSLQSRDVSFARFASSGERGLPPGEDLSRKLFQEQVCHEARVASISVRERMNRHYPVVIASGNHCLRECLVVDLCAHITSQLVELCWDLSPLAPDVLVGATKVTSPTPGRIEHAPVHRADELAVKRISAPTRVGPAARTRDIFLLVVVELALQRDM